MDDIKTEVSEQEATLTEPSEAESAIRQEVQEIKEAVNEVVSETSLADKVDELRIYIENISEDVQSWRTSRAETYIEALETLKSQVDEIQGEWNAVSSAMKAQRERLESLLESSPGVIETSTLRALSLRVTHLENLVAKLVGEADTKSAAARARKQLIISFAALGVTIVLWGIWLSLALIK